MKNCLPKMRPPAPIRGFKATFSDRIESMTRFTNHRVHREGLSQIRGFSPPSRSIHGFKATLSDRMEWITIWRTGPTLSADSNE